MISLAVVFERAKIPCNIRASDSEKALTLSRTICLICSAFGSPFSFRFPKKPRSSFAGLAGVGSVCVDLFATTSESVVSFVVSESFCVDLDLSVFNCVSLPFQIIEVTLLTKIVRCNCGSTDKTKVIIAHLTSIFQKKDLSILDIIYRAQRYC